MLIRWAPGSNCDRVSRRNRSRVSSVSGSVLTSTRVRARKAGSASAPPKACTPCGALPLRDQPATG
ncbi:Uncharacterised protein [Bordetella pertussis]|nr:Uncharacterised protein [Bordetella pertussis]